MCTLSGIVKLVAKELGCQPQQERAEVGAVRSTQQQHRTYNVSHALSEAPGTMCIKLSIETGAYRIYHQTTTESTTAASAAAVRIISYVPGCVSCGVIETELSAVRLT